MPSSSNTQRNINRLRVNPAARDVDRPNLQNIAIHGEFALDKEGDRFLLHDSRVTEPLLPVFFIFCTDDGLNRLRENPNWAGDGTFKGKFKCAVTGKLLYSSHTPVVFTIVLGQHSR